MGKRAKYVLPLLGLACILALGGCTLEWGGGGEHELVAVIRADPLFGPPPLTVTFNAMDSIGAIVSYVWDFGDGTGGEGAVVQHTYSESGVYVVMLTVHDRYGQEAQARATITVLREHMFDPIEFTDIDIRPVGPCPPWWNPDLWPEDYFPEGVVLQFRLMYEDKDPVDDIVLVTDTLEWVADRVQPCCYTRYNVGYGENPWIPIERPWVGGTCQDPVPWKYVVTVKGKDSAGNQYFLSKEFWIACQRCTPPQ